MDIAMIYCLVLMGPIAMEAGHANEGDTIQLPAADAEMFARWGYVRIVDAPAAENPAEPEPTPTETATQRRRREAAEAKAAQEAAELAANLETEPPA